MKVYVGKNIKIKNNIGVGSKRDGIYFISIMKEFCGKEATITNINRDLEISLTGPPNIENFAWKSVWFEQNDFLSDKDFEI